MPIFKPSKILLYEKIKANADYVFGATLDAGAGGVNRYGSLFKKMTKYISLDIKPEYHPEILAPVDNIPLPDSSVDSIICTQVIGDCESPDKTIKEFSRIIKSGGVVLLSESFMNEIHGQPYDFWRFTHYGLRRLFETNDFEIIKIEQVGGFFSVMAQNQIRYFIEKFKLGQKKNLSRFFKPLLNIFGRLMIYFDTIDTSEANRLFAISWLVIARKK